jgi:hypothetical protein
MPKWCIVPVLLSYVKRFSSSLTKELYAYIFQVDQRLGIDSQVQSRHLQEGMDLGMVCMVIIPGIGLRMTCHLLKKWLVHVSLFLSSVLVILNFIMELTACTCYLINFAAS